MLVSVLQTLAEILAGGTSLISTEQIDFGRPGSRRDEGTGPLLNLYFYDIRESKHVQHSGRQVERHTSEGKPYTAKVNWSPNWFDVSLLLTAWDRTVLGEHHLLTEAMAVLLRHRSLQEHFLAHELRGYGNFPLSVAVAPSIDIGALWSALGLPLRPALYLTLSVPFADSSVVAPRVWERSIRFQPNWTNSGNYSENYSETNLENHPENHPENHQILSRRVVIAGIVKSATTAKPLTETTVSIPDTDKRTVSNQEGLFFFEGLHDGNYMLNLQHSGYAPRICNVLVDNGSTTFKEILLFPVQSIQT